MKDDDDREPYDCRPELEAWKAGNRNWSTVMKMRTFRFLEYPQVDRAAYETLGHLCEIWAKENPLTNPNPNQAGLEVLSENLAKGTDWPMKAAKVPTSYPIAKSTGKTIAVFLGMAIGTILTIIGFLIWMFIMFLSRGSWVG